MQNIQIQTLKVQSGTLTCYLKYIQKPKPHFTYEYGPWTSILIGCPWVLTMIVIWIVTQPVWPPIFRTFDYKDNIYSLNAGGLDEGFGLPIFAVIAIDIRIVTTVRLLK